MGDGRTVERDRALSYRMSMSWIACFQPGLIQIKPQEFGYRGNHDIFGLTVLSDQRAEK
jgi:hypothetical protein